MIHSGAISGVETPTPGPSLAQDDREIWPLARASYCIMHGNKATRLVSWHRDYCSRGAGCMPSTLQLPSSCTTIQVLSESHLYHKDH